MATTLGIQDSFSTSDQERGSPPGRSPMSRYIPGDVCPFLPPAWHLGWLDFGWVVGMLPGGTDGRETQMGTKASVLDGRTRELGRARLGFGVFSPFQENGVQRSSGGIARVSQVALILKKPPANAGDVRDVDSMLGLGRSSGGGHGNPLQYSCLENLMDRRGWRATVHRGAESDITEQLSTQCKGTQSLGVGQRTLEAQRPRGSLHPVLLQSSRGDPESLLPRACFSLCEGPGDPDGHPSGTRVFTHTHTHTPGFCTMKRTKQPAVSFLQRQRWCLAQVKSVRSERTPCPPAAWSCGGEQRKGRVYLSESH